jgi:hypothetical protein
VNCRSFERLSEKKFGSIGKVGDFAATDWQETMLSVLPDVGFLV